MRWNVGKRLLNVFEKILDSPLLFSAVVDDDEGNVQILKKRTIPNVAKVIIADDTDIGAESDHFVKFGDCACAQPQNGTHPSYLASSPKFRFPRSVDVFQLLSFCSPFIIIGFSAFRQ